jgi:hypothetical protein
MKPKRGQSGMNAAILVAIIAGIMILYIIFISPEEREKILVENEENGGHTTSRDNISLLSETIGTLDLIGKLDDRDIPNIYLIESVNSKELDSINPVYVRNGWFDKRIKQVTFYIDNLEDTDNIVLSFTAPKRKGILTIKLNDNVIFDYDVQSLNVEPIKLPKNILKNENILEFSVSGVGMAFWSTNEYDLENIKVIGDITDKSRQESRNTFSLTGAQYKNIKQATIKFIPYCSRASEVGMLNVYINNRNIFSAVPVCEDLVKQDVPLSVLNEGENNVVFKTDKGSYSIEQIKIEMAPIEKKSYLAYYFDINSTVFEDIRDGDKNVILRIEFVDEDSDKKAELDVNDHLYMINIKADDEKKVYERYIDSWIEKGSNFVKLTPQIKMEIVKLEVLVID